MTCLNSLKDRIYLSYLKPQLKPTGHANVCLYGVGNTHAQIFEHGCVNTNLAGLLVLPCRT